MKFAVDEPRATPLVGRDRERATVDRLRSQAAAGSSAVLLISGDGGIGKTRLVSELAHSATAAGAQMMIGRAYALEADIPYAPFADACEPTLAALERNVLLRFTRGDRVVLTALAPSVAFDAAAVSRADGATFAEQHLRLHAGILQLLTQLAVRQPLVLVLENLQWADSASLGLFHFIARHLGKQRILLVGTWNETERELSDEFRTMVRSLRGLAVVTEVRLEPLERVAVGQLISARFGVDVSAINAFVTALHEVSRGNPLFVEQTLEELVARGTLQNVGGVWVGWQLDSVALPHSVRDVIQARLVRLTPDARLVAELVAIAGTTVEHDVLRSIASDLADRPVQWDDAALLAALDVLRRQGIVIEQIERETVTYDAAHPMLRQALIETIGLTRERAMHANFATVIANRHGNRAEQHAERIAAHWQLADPREHVTEAVRWLVTAGRAANERHALREAASAFRAALNRADGHPELVDDATVPLLLDELARLYRRLGHYQLAIEMGTRARDLAVMRDDDRAIAIAERRLGLANDGLGRRVEANAHFDVGIARATAAGEVMLTTRLRLAKGDALQSLGDVDGARREIAQALDMAEQRNDLELLARAHRSLLKLHTWSGPAHRAWAHARSAVELAEQSGARNLAWSAHWSAAVLAGFTSNITALQHHLVRATRLADELHSPLLQLRTAEIAVEFYSGTGEWDRALHVGQQAISQARALEQSTNLTRLLVWVGAVYLHRGESAEAHTMFDEAWSVSGAEALDLERLVSVHAVLPALSARVMALGSVGDHVQAVALGRRALGIADRAGAVAWTVYRLVPAIAESACALDDAATIAEMRERLARDAAVLAHTVGRGWVSLLDAELALRGESYDAAIVAFQQAITTLEAVPIPFDAACARARLARLLERLGDIDEASREARAAFELFDKLGARPSADAMRTLLRSLGARLPVRRVASGIDGLTGRELEIVRLIARRLSNKEIGAQLNISARTVGTHLANMFDKVGVRDRTALGDVARELGLHRQPDYFSLERSPGGF